MKIAYFDCLAGISGDMTLGALIDCGVPLNYLEDQLKKLNISNFSLKEEKVIKKGITATKVHVNIAKENKGRHLSHIKEIIYKSSLSEIVKNNAFNIFENLAKAEAKIHGTTIEKIHFHEVGAMDSIIDIIGTCICLDYLKIDKIKASKIHVGTGFVECDHGKFPLPAPATSELLKEMKIYSTGIEKELTTPTGAAILKTFSKKSFSMPEMDVETIGYGAGNRDLDIPNVLRIYIGEIREESDLIEYAKMVETNIDDMNPEIYEIVMEKLFEAGAYDVFFSPVQMKKNRPATKLSVLIPYNEVEKFKEIIFMETTTFGIRVYDVEKHMLLREFKEIKTEFGKINIKLSKFNGKIINATPEYEDCKLIAKKVNKPLKEIYELAKFEFFKL